MRQTLASLLLLFASLCGLTQVPENVYSWHGLTSNCSTGDCHPGDDDRRVPQLDHAGDAAAFLRSGRDEQDFSGFKPQLAIHLTSTLKFLLHLQSQSDCDVPAVSARRLSRNFPLTV